MKLKRPLYGPDHSRGPSHGRDVKAVKRGLHKVEDRFFSRPPGGFDDVYNRKTEEAVRIFQRINDIPDTGKFGQNTLDALWPYMDAYARFMYRTYFPPKRPTVPDLGPVVAGGKSVLSHDLTHATAGLPGYPAFDDGWIIGKECLAPEPMVISRTSSAQGGRACFARGETCDWWFGHISMSPPVGKRYSKGERFGVISADHKRPHLHVGINTDRLLGRELLHRTDYSHGYPTVGEQFEKALT